MANLISDHPVLWIWEQFIQFISHANYDLNNRLFVCYSSYYLNNWPFNDWTGLDHLNTKQFCYSALPCMQWGSEYRTSKRLVFKCLRYSNGWFSDPHCIPLILFYFNRLQTKLYLQVNLLTKDEKKLTFSRLTVFARMKVNVFHHATSHPSTNAHATVNGKDIIVQSR